MTRKRSSYRPRGVFLDPLVILRPASIEQRNGVMLVFLTALEAMARGEHPGEDEWRSLSDAINTLETLATRMNLLEIEPTMRAVNAAIAAMVGAANRFKAGQRMGVDAAGLSALRDVISMYDECLQALTARQMAVAQRLTQQRINEIMHSRTRQAEVVSL